MNSISILMCSFNGNELLHKSVLAITKLSVHKFDYVEFVFVDNGSDSDLQELVKNIWYQNNPSIHLKTTLEPKKGKTAAFLKGFSLCKGEYIVICDDDNVLFENYLVEGSNYLNSNPYVGVLGGQGLPMSDVHIPSWLNQYLINFACGPQAKQNGNVFPERNVVYGAGMWFRSSALTKALSVGFCFMFDYVKSNPSMKDMSNGGEDGELCWAIKYQNLEVHYLDSLKFNHIIDKIKFSDDYLRLINSRKLKYTLLSQVYRRVYFMNVLSVNNYWKKELIYILINYVKNFTFRKDYLIDETIRNITNLYFLLIYRSKYDDIFNKLLKYKRNFN